MSKKIESQKSFLAFIYDFKSSSKLLKDIAIYLRSIGALDRDTSVRLDIEVHYER